ncbi:MAG: hypothetical protein IKC87_04645 [Clostridia bacterium]|nr:hypothetical protein [Clostridia bacterium]
MKKLTLSKYLTTALRWLMPFALLEILACVLYFTGIAEGYLFAVVNVVDFVFLLLPGGYYLAMFFVFNKKSKSTTPEDGVIINWESGFFRYTGSVIVKVDGKEYSTAAYFSQEEAKEMVGKAVSYAIIADTLFIYEVKESESIL